MAKFRRRKLLATGTALGGVGLFGSLSTAANEHDEDEERGGSELPSFEEPDDWSSYSGTAGNTGSVPGNGAFPKPETVAWEHDESGHIAITDGQVYLRSGSSIYALDDSDGSVIWTSDDVGAEGGVQYGTPAVTDATVVVGGDRLTALDADSGEVRWTQKFDSGGGEAVTSPTVAFDTVFVIAEESLHAFDLADGSLQWSRDSVELEPHEDSDMDESQEVSFGSTPIAVTDEFVYAGVGHDNPAGVAAFDALEGETQWTYAVDETSVEYGGAHKYILATETRIYAMGRFADQGLMYPALDPWTGEQVDSEHSSRSQPAVTDEVRVGTGRHGFSVKNHETGEEWGRNAYEWGHTDAWGRPAIAGETLVIPYYVGAPQGHENDGIYGLNLEDGSEQWHFTHPDVENTDVREQHGFVVSGESIYITGGDQLQVLRPETEEPEEDPDEEEPENDDDEPENKSDIELSVSAPGSVPYEETADPSEDAADFCITVTNHGDETSSVDGQFKIGPIDEPLPLELEPGETDTVNFGVMSRDLGPGDYEWNVTANGETKTGTLTVTNDKEC
ncbi:PQQ-binding-like beta-propeller repeat protein [Natronococcus sp. JC468]|uniref:outer membrane protein assembly factor BamB family protein n=1 Tax=Natronococcus sp. JC468 TaxID=1961921 RepID=UPI001439FDD3|nr:PQQ-binding-like beta-propeller repeat protein [Natronococcus sp. JC468]NKE37765.1 PQQ-binding-like beta-propeller repeat protein [Natronococcus sp. JC468]